MNPESMLITAITALAGCIGILFTWARAEFAKCQARELQCALKYEKILLHLANVEQIKDLMTVEMPKQ